MRYICFDVETPNRRNDRMSAIGVCVVENGAVTKEFYSLVDPEEPFEEFNIALTHITPELVENAPTFKDLWAGLAPTFDSGLLVAHNAQFDMSVLSKCLKDYGISFGGMTSYICTCRMSKRLMPDLENHRLDTICRALKIPLQHHNALSDARGCAEILIHCLSQTEEVSRFIRPYDLALSKTLRHI